MRRRWFIAGLATTAAWSMLARAQQAVKLPRLGFIGSSTASAMSSWIAAFTRRLGELGWIEKKTITIEYQFADGRNDRYVQIANNFVRQKVDVIVTYGTPPTKAAKAATQIIPVVFAAAADPVGAGLVQSLARQGGNITGITNITAELAGKRLEIIKEIVP